MTSSEQGQQRPLPTPIRADSLQRLLEISARLSSTLHLDTLLALVMDISTELTHTDRKSVV